MSPISTVNNSVKKGKIQKRGRSNMTKFYRILVRLVISWSMVGNSKF